ncbi:TrmH family RNA methyltransferase [Cellulomonas hominis]
MSTELTNPRAERVRAVRALVGRPARRRSGTFLVEGPQAVREAALFAADLVRELYLTGPAAERYTEIVAAATEAGIGWHLASTEVLDAMSADAQGVVAVAAAPSATLDDVVAAGPRLVAVLANVRDPGNAGTVIRAADAAGAHAVVLAGECVDPLNPKVVRSTAGSLFHLPVVTGVTVEAAVAALRGAGLLVLAADGAGELDLDDLQDVALAARRGGGTSADARPDPAGSAPAAPDATAPDLASATAWLFGNEAWGLRPDDRDLADAVVRVPIRGRAESLNLATAATVCLYASARAQRPR